MRRHSITRGLHRPLALRWRTVFAAAPERNDSFVFVPRRLSSEVGKHARFVGNKVSRNFAGVSAGSTTSVKTAPRFGPWTSSKVWNDTHRPRNRNMSTVNRGNDAISTDTLILGGSVVGSSVAYHLALSRGGSSSTPPGITVVEPDPTYANDASATRSAGGIRQQFSLKENVQMSLYGRDFLQSAADNLTLTGDGEEEKVDVQFREHGYLFLASTAEGEGRMRANHATQVEAGCDPEDIVILDRSELRDRFPWLNVDDVVAGSLGVRGEGWFDPWSLLTGMRDKAIELGVTYVRGRPVRSVRDGDDATGKVVSVDVEMLDARGGGTGRVVRYDVNSIVNATGAHASNVLDLLAGPSRPLRHPLPVRPRKRCIFFFHCGVTEEEDGCPPLAPLTVDPTTLVYFRSEGSGKCSNFLCGVSPPENVDVDYDDPHPPTVDSSDDETLFHGTIWPALYHRVPAFGSIKVKSSWAGLYDYNVVDRNAIVGFHPELTNVLLVNGFSGHGLQCSPAAGRAAAELLDDGGRFRTLDLSIFGFDRFLDGGGGPVFEEGIV